MGRNKSNRFLKELPEQILKGNMKEQWRLFKARAVETDAYLRIHGTSLDAAIAAAYEITGHLGLFIRNAKAIQKKRSKATLQIVEEHERKTY